MAYCVFTKMTGTEDSRRKVERLLHALADLASPALNPQCRGPLALDCEILERKLVAKLRDDGWKIGSDENGTWRVETPEDFEVDSSYAKIRHTAS